jgi:hypothetical protein
MLSFTCKKKDIVAAIQFLAPALPEPKAIKGKLVCELEFDKDRLKITIPGASSYCAAEYNKIVKAFVPYLVLVQFLNDWSEEDFTVSIEREQICAGRMHVESELIRIAEPTQQRNIDLTMNYSTLDILKMGELFSKDEIKRKNFYDELIMTQYKMKDDIFDAETLLSKYGIKYDELQRIVRQKISNHKLS